MTGGLHKYYHVTWNVSFLNFPECITHPMPPLNFLPFGIWLSHFLIVFFYLHASKDNNEMKCSVFCTGNDSSESIPAILITKYIWPLKMHGWAWKKCVKDGIHLHKIIFIGVKQGCLLMSPSKVEGKGLFEKILNPTNAVRRLISHYKNIWHLWQYVFFPKKIHCLSQHWRISNSTLWSNFIRWHKI